MARPNILILMVDQLNGTLFPDGPAEFLHAPHLKALAKRSVRFANTYTASPLCAPARASFMSGQLPSRTRVYDNAAEFASDIPTFAHHLRAAGYHTALSGKMHFVGPDQLHGFEERLTTDIYPADFGWTPDYTKPGERIDWWYHNLGSVTGAGVAEITNQMEYDDEVAYNATRKLYDLSRRHDDRPWCLTVSFTHPHDPYVARRKYWDLYENCPALDPDVDALPFDQQDPHSQRLLKACDYDAFEITREQIRRARQGYFASISYIDDKIGELLDVLERGRMADNTIVLFVSDHGDMLGERGLWFKMCFFDGSSRVPLTIAAPGWNAACIQQPVSTLDVTPTLAALAGIDMTKLAPWTDGEDLAPLATGTGARGPVAMEYAAEGSEAPLVCLRDGRFKLTLCDKDPPMLFDLQADPRELTNLAGDAGHAEVLARLKAEADKRWNLQSFDAAVRESQARRWVVYEALRNGAYYPWDYQPLQKASERYMRNHMDLNVLEESQRYPRGE
ncbi:MULTISPECIES: choline-sulfatase [Rhizobium]|uniref:Choline sulfatase protein n=1 Tax=Rhizobium favelukesii TaxID=348824 RepID=W6R6R7_9HYPH|nr:MULTISPECIES: choline-sulfatase [Rhizobium]MCA0804232.1 choline-sulfatase [Rhizobium sp. T1473]MCS0458411.1 choline-sulfatase [Rhizobium favelukesii]UFS82230.1 choline-sulfatase [Rhizobium sp. T136]CDM56090.1 choline sulfatase protein [Rhizobium favelukesii]